MKLVTSGRRHIAPDGIFVTTEHLAGNDAAMKAQITLCAKKRTAEEKEALLLRLICRKKESGEIAAQRVQKIYLTDEDTRTVTQKFVVEEADLWSPRTRAPMSCQQSCTPAAKTAECLALITAFLRRGKTG